MTAAVPARLQIVNAFISLCRPHDGWASTLHDVGYRLAGIEVPVRDESGGVTLDAVATHTARDALLAAECKSGNNIAEEQARRLSVLDSAAVIRMAAVSAVGGDEPPTIEAIFVCFRKSARRIEQGLAACEVVVPIISVGDTALERRGAHFADAEIVAAFAEPVRVVGPPPAYLVLDEHSSPEEFDERTSPNSSPARRVASPISRCAR